LTNFFQLHAGVNLVPVETSKQELLAAQDYKVLQKVFERLDKKKDGKIDKDELLEYLLRVKYEPVKVNQYGVSEVEHM
jgi:Ca2+-binding EF-hand superfamily protein